jgi:hypothetical protein
MTGSSAAPSPAWRRGGWRVAARRAALRWRRVPGVTRLVAWYARRPFVTMWAVLAAGMVAMIVLFGVDAGLTFRQHVTLAAIAALLAWLCTWIIFLEPDKPNEPNTPAEPDKPGA